MLCPSWTAMVLPAPASGLHGHLSFSAPWTATAGPGSGLSRWPCPGTLHLAWVCPRSPGLCLGWDACWPLCLLGLLHLWPVLKLSSLLTFRRPPSTLGLSPRTVTQPGASLSPRLSRPKSVLAGSCAWVRTITPAAPALGSARQTPPLGLSVMSALPSSLHSLFGDVSSCLSLIPSRASWAEAWGWAGSA